MLAGVRGYIATVAGNFADVAVFIAADGGKQKIAEKSVAEGVIFIAEGVGKQKKAASP